MKDFKELQELVGRRGFGTALYGNINGDPVYLSRGIREFFLDGDNIQKIITAVDGFQKGAFGLAQSRGKQQVKGHEYGCYDICGLPAQDGEDNTVWVHRDDDAIIVYFRFER